MYSSTMGAKHSSNCIYQSKRLLIITFSIKAISIQSSKCFHSINFILVGSKACVLSINQTSTSLTFYLVLYDAFHVTTLSFSNITLTVIPSISKMVCRIIYISFTACLTAQR